MSNAKVKINREEQANLCKRYIDTLGYNADYDYYYKNHYFVELDGGYIVTIDKPRIETSFCCGEDEGMGGRTIKEANEILEGKKTEHGFKAANIGEFDEMIIATVGRKVLKFTKEYPDFKSDFHFIPVLVKNGNHATIENNCRYVCGEKIRVFTDDDFRKMRNAYMIVRADYIKRVNAYWKRFGASKIRTWTYWMSA